jgi:hypothetical protein
MPRRRPVKPFIDKKASEHFSVVHRSQLDPKFYDDEASKFVLMSSKAKLAFSGDGEESLGGPDAAASVASGAREPSRRRGGGGGIADAGYDAASVAGSVRVKQLRVVGGSGASAAGERRRLKGRVGVGSAVVGSPGVPTARCRSRNLAHEKRRVAGLSLWGRAW